MDLTVPRSGEFSNTRVVERMRHSSAQVLLLVAPAGYGKTEAARSLSQSYDNVAWCDCGSVSSVKDLLDSVLAALARSANGASFAQAQIEISRSDDELGALGIFERAWTEDAPHSLFIFENCERLAELAGMPDLLYRLLVTAPKGRRIVVSSRTALPVRAGRHLPPHRLLKLTASDFTLEDEGARSLLAREGVDPACEERIISVARGWPVILLLLARLAREGRLDVALNDAGSIEFEDLFNYFLHEILSPLGRPERRVLLLASVVPSATEEELAGVLELPPLEIRAIAHNLPLLRSHSGECSVHPLLAAIIRQQEPGWRDEVRRVAKYNADCGNLTRAALLFREAQDEHAAASCLAALPMEQLLTPSNLVELSHLSIDAIVPYPQLAIGIIYSTSPLRIAPGRARIAIVALEAAFFHMDPATDPSVLAGIIFALTSAQWFFGMREQHHRVLTDERTRQALASTSPMAHLLLVGTPEILQSADGSIESSYPGMQAALAETRATGMVRRAAPIACNMASVHRWRGEREESLRCLGEGVALSVAAKSPSLLLCSLAHAVANGWFWDGDEGLQPYQEQLDLCSRELGARIDLSAIDVDDATLEITADGVTLPAAPSVELLLMRAARTQDPQRCAIFEKTRRILDGADPLIQSLYFIARASAEPQRRREYFEQALALTSPTEARDYTAAITAALEERPSFLDSYLRRFAPTDVAAVAGGSITLKLLCEELNVNGQIVPLTRREAAFLAYVARQRVPSTREELQDALWPDLDERGARDSLYSLVHRLRKRIGNIELVRNAGNACTSFSRTPALFGFMPATALMSPRPAARRISRYVA